MISLLINGTRQSLTVLEALALQGRLEKALKQALIKCRACGHMTLPLVNCRECGRTL